MASMPAKKSDSVYEAFLAVPPHRVAEIVHGELRTFPRPALPHAGAASHLGGELYNPFKRGKGGPGGWILLDEPELRIHGHILVPDLAGWRQERAPSLSAPFSEVAPDWVCEVISPSTETHDRNDKMPIYVEMGVEHAWLINPLARRLEAYRRDAARWQSTGVWEGDACVRAPPFEVYDLALAALWVD